MPLSRLQSAYLVGRRRAQAQARRERDDLVAEFEEINDQTHAELRGLRNELARMHAIDDAIAVERDETQRLN